MPFLRNRNLKQLLSSRRLPPKKPAFEHGEDHVDDEDEMEKDDKAGEDSGSIEDSSVWAMMVPSLLAAPKYQPAKAPTSHQRNPFSDKFFLKTG